MESYIRCDTSHVGSQKVKEIEKKLEAVLSRVPADATPKVSILKNDLNQWMMDLSVKFSRGHIGITRVGMNLNELADQVSEELDQKIKLWHEQRGVETFHFDRADEYDFYCHFNHKVPTIKDWELNVLVVEDDPAASTVMRSTLMSLGCEVLVASDPTMARDLVMNRNLDLIVLDWNLPYQNGRELLMQVDEMLSLQDKSKLPTKLTPVVICSSLPIEHIELPALKHFYFINHWHKGLPFSSILQSLDRTIELLVDKKQSATL